MRPGRPFFHGQRIVQQENTLAGPIAQIAMTRRDTAHICLQFLEDIGQRARHRHMGLDRKGKTMRLTRAVIGSCPRITTLT
jgi:hypothetical protein